MGSARGAPFRWYEGFAISLAVFAGQLSTELINQWGNYFYSPPPDAGRAVYVPIALVSLIFAVPILINWVASPLIAVCSDKTDPTRASRFLFGITGRRRPYIFAGSILMFFTNIAFWYPPVPHESPLNILYGVTVLGLHMGVLIVMVTIPVTALGLEAARTPRERIRLGVWIALGMVIGLAATAVLSGVLISSLDPARHGPTHDAFSAVGYQRTAQIFALVALVFFQMPVWLIRERYVAPPQRDTTPIIPKLIGVLRNRLLRFYIATFLLFNIGYVAVQRVVAYWAELGLNGSEETVTWLMLPFVTAALLSLATVPAMARRYNIKWLLFTSLAIMSASLPLMYPIATMNASGIGRVAAAAGSVVGMDFAAGAQYDVLGKLALGLSLFFICGLGQGIMFAILAPLQGEIVDLDETRTGRRQEAVYNSLSDLTWKVSALFGAVLPNVSMSLLGNSVDRPYGVFLVGPIAGLFGIMGLIVAWYYPKGARDSRIAKNDR